jgi:hypothetical protein
MIQQLLSKNFGSKLSFDESKASRFKNEEELFTSVIDSIYENIDRSIKLFNEFSIDIFDYDSTFIEIIENMFLLKYGPAITEIIMWYVLDREIPNEEGEFIILPLTLENHETETTEEIYLNNSKELWDFISKITPII